MKRRIFCIASVGLISVLLAVGTVYACCGMNPVLTVDPVEPQPCCVGVPVTIEGTISGTAVWGDTYYSTDAEVEVEITSPGGTVTTIVATLSGLVESGDPGQDPPELTATWNFAAEYTPMETGTYTSVIYGEWTAAGGGGTMDVDIAGPSFDVEECVMLDLKPGSCPNAFNRTKKGVLPAAIVGTASLDVSTIDPTTIELEGVAPLKVSIADVIEPYTDGVDGDPCYECFEAPPTEYDADGNIIWQYAGDGIDDLVMQFDAQLIAAVPDIADAARGDCIELTLSYTDAAGVVVEISDSLWIVK